jgi:HSP20 family molecular chaperone IbpA
VIPTVRLEKPCAVHKLRTRQRRGSQPLTLPGRASPQSFERRERQCPSHATSPGTSCRTRRAKSTVYSSSASDANSGTSSSATADWAPPVDINEYADRFGLFVDLPGVDPRTVEITLDNDVLTLSGERSLMKRAGESQPLSRQRIERSHGRCVILAPFPAVGRPSGRSSHRPRMRAAALPARRPCRLRERMRSPKRRRCCSTRLPEIAARYCQWS